ncbi:STAS domain-containing protein [Geodermatophilus amargosae]|uniref:STAS domain-containing protein n=1 Tax=Geodermatophilus amargosae TaxID=1296565 RepID=UPI0034DFA97B
MGTTGALQGDDRRATTEVVVSRRGSVRVSGHLTVQGADLLRGTVESLRRSGHARVLLDLADVRGADLAGLRVLRDLERTMAAGGGELRLLAPPTSPAPLA